MTDTENSNELGYEYDVAICLDTVKAIRFFFVGGHNIIVDKDKLAMFLFAQRLPGEKS